MNARPSGWYDDPNEPSRLRYWDGESWTERTNPKAPMPAPQPARQPVTRLRPAHEAEDRPRPAAPETREGGAVVSGVAQPRPWETGGDGRSAANVHGRARTGDAVVEPARAGMLRRLPALLIDLVVPFLVFTLLMAAAMPFLGDTMTLATSWAESVFRAGGQGQPTPEPPAELVTFSAMMSLAYAALVVLYEFVMTQTVGSTLGHLATGVRVVRDGEDALTPFHLLGRAVFTYAFFVLSAIPGAGMIGLAFSLMDLISPLSDKRRRTLHERWSGTRAVLRRSVARQEPGPSR